MYGIMSGLEPRGYADGDLVQKALDLGVTPFGMSDEEIMQAISQKQQVDDMSGASGDIGKGFSAFNENVKDYVFDYTDPLEYATLPFLAPKLAMKGKKVFDAVRGSGGALSKNARGLGAYIGTDILARDVMGYQNPFGKDAQDEAAEDLAEMQDNEFIDFEEDGGISLIDPDKPMETGMSSEDIAKEIGDKKAPFDKMKGLAALAEALGTSSGDVPQMTRTGDQFFGSNTFKPPGVMRMADGGIAQFGIGGIVSNIGKGFIKGGKDFYKKVTKKEAKQKGADVDKKKPDTKKETGVTKDAPEGPSALDFVDPYSAAAIRGSAKMATDLASATTKNIKPIAGAIGTYGTLGGIGYGLGSALLGDDKPPVIPPTVIADGGGDMDVLDGESLKDIHYSRSMARAQEAGRDKPTFVDYVASFPGSYTDKLGKDPEFAKQMMAGFVAMMTPSEGIVERSGVADFAGGVLKEQARQEGEVPDQIKLMQAIQESPELLAAYRKFSAGAIDPKDYNAVAASLMTTAQEIVGVQPSVNRVIKSKERLLKPDGTVVTAAELVSIYEKDNRAGVIEFAKTLTPEEG
tara:strand:+ start:309 stop:2033 length:1725 start_codon:yes stop_codon:yes gene_type:complete